MLLFSRPGIIKLLPALPDKWIKGSFSGMLCRGQVTVSVKWDFGNGFFEASLLSRLSQSVTLKFPRVPRAVRIKAANAGRAPELKPSPYGDQYLIIDLEAGQPVRIELDQETEC